jgi:hypothetical protein
LPVDDGGSIIVALWVGEPRVGIYIRGQRGAEPSELIDRLDPLRNILEETLGTGYRRGNGPYICEQSKPFDMTNPANWGPAIDWLHNMAAKYLNTVRQALPEAA